MLKVPIERANRFSRFFDHLVLLSISHNVRVTTSEEKAELWDIWCGSFSARVKKMYAFIS